MDTVLIILCIVIIALVLLQSGKAEGASQIITGGAGDLFKNRKERGSELIISNFYLRYSILYNLFSNFIYIKYDSLIMSFFNFYDKIKIGDKIWKIKY